MLTPDNSKEMQAFAVTSLEGMIDEAVRRIMGSSDLFMRVFSLVDYHGASSFSYDI
jgi:hypothetical protein